MNRPAPLANRIFIGSKAIERGLLTYGELRGPTWRRLFRDVYADEALSIDHKLRYLAAGRFLLPDGAAIAGRSAAHLFGVPYLDATDPVEVLTPQDFGPVKGLKIRRGPLGSADTARRGRLRVTSPLRTGWDIARWFDLPEAMVFLDALASRRLITKAALIDYANARHRSVGWSRVVRAARLIEPAAESPQETRLRVQLALAGLPAPVVQFEIADGGRFVARVDLAWPRLRIAVEYDGAWHGAPQQLERDRERLNRLLEAGWLVFHVTAKQMREGLSDFTAQLNAAVRVREREGARMSR